MEPKLKQVPRLSCEEFFAIAKIRAGSPSE